MRRQRLSALLIGFALVAAACGGGATDTATSTESSSTAGAGGSAPTTAVPSIEPETATTIEQTDESAPERPAPDPNREIAPDFDLLLSDGSTFVLSEETRPVFMVFWAEW